MDIKKERIKGYKIQGSNISLKLDSLDYKELPGRFICDVILININSRGERRDGVNKMPNKRE